MAVKLNITDLKEALDLTPSTQNIMLVGKHGIGKSEILTNHFAKKGMKVVALFLGQMSDPGDIIGLPSKVQVLDEKGKPIDGQYKTDFLAPYWFPTDGKPVVLFLDELNRARPEILQTVMDLTLNRKLAGKPLPQGSRVISAVNDGDEYQLTDLDPALVSRFNIYEFNPTVNEWLDWAEKKGLDDRVINFIQDNPTWLDGEPVAKEQKYAGLEKSADRRAWERVSDIVENIDVIKDVHKRIIAGVVGAGAAAAFIQTASKKNVITGKDLLLNYEKTIKKVAKYKLHEYAILNESVYRFLDNEQLSTKDAKTVGTNLKLYLDYLVENKKNEAMANFTSIFEKNNYKHALSFIITKCGTVYDTLTDFVTNL